MNDPLMLVIGKDHADVADLFGFASDHKPGDVAREDRRSLKVPDSIWDPSQRFTMEKAFGWPPEEFNNRYDAVIITAAGWAMLTAANPGWTRASFQNAMNALVREGSPLGWTWVEE